MIEYPDYEAAILERQEGFEIWEDDPDSSLAVMTVALEDDSSGT